MENLMLKNMARSLVLAGVITFGAAGVANAAGAGDQTGKHGDMSGHGGPVDKKAGSGAGQKPAPEPGTYRQSGGSTSGQTGGTTGGSAGQGMGSGSTGAGSGSGSSGSGSSGQSGGGGGY